MKSTHTQANCYSNTFLRMIISVSVLAILTTHRTQWGSLFNYDLTVAIELSLLQESSIANLVYVGHIHCSVLHCILYTNTMIFHTSNSINFDRSNISTFRIGDFHHRTLIIIHDQRAEMNKMMKLNREINFIFIQWMTHNL